MAAHQFSVNNDSLSGDGAHNYYLYEKDGRLNLIPWDYNLCLGAYDMEDMEADDESDTVASGNTSEGNDSPPQVTETATDVVNDPIDDSWRRTTFFDGILEDPEYQEIYHRNFQRLIDGYLFGGGFDLFYSRTRAQIDALVKSDPNALYSYEAYDKAAKMLRQTVELRGKSVKGQLDASIPSTAEEQKKHPELLIDAGGIDLKTMGGDSVDEDMEEWTGEGSEEDWSEEDWEKKWQAEMNQFQQKQKEARHKTIRYNALLYTVCFLMAVAACVIALVYRRRRM